MTTRTTGARRSALVAEVIVLALLYVADLVALLSRPRAAPGPWTSLLIPLTPALGLGVATMALLRRRFARGILILSLVAVASLVVSLMTWVSVRVGSQVWAQPAFAETTGICLLTGSLLRRSSLSRALPATLLAACACVAAFPLRFGLEGPWSLAAIGAAVAWGAAVGIGLVLRDTDRRRTAELEAVREHERVALAQELHDFVAHHISGIVVLAQGAQVRARSRPGSDAPVLQEIERAGGEAMTAMRRLVGMLRTPSDRESDPHDVLHDALRDACGDRGDVRLRVGDRVAEAEIPATLVPVAHRVVLESVTNARRHAPRGTTIEVEATVERKGFTATLVLEIRNVAPHRSRREGGYGLVGMTERVQAVGGTLVAGRADGDRWLVSARMPLPSTSSWGDLQP
ncbi:sensor histidine kinase [Kribbella sp. NPDC051587]|uniref:sensor histidine kinase n=1 Tax=Kribbella sp. NPDC051587 TaxID=3364119 RepID=UPI0037A670DB